METISVKRTHSENKDFINLVKLLDAELAERDGQEHSFYDQFNKLDNIRHAVLLYENDKPVACGAMKEFEPGTMEIKRMFTLPAVRGRGFAGLVLQELEKWGREFAVQNFVLETGRKQPEAISLYLKSGYRKIPNYGQYTEIGNSVCFKKSLT